jgi:dCMP deaminase
MAAVHQEFMAIARNIAHKSNCIRRSVGAVLVRHHRIVAMGWNGVSSAYKDCGEARCSRCIRGGPTGMGYEECICIHGEQRAIASAAARGVATKGSVLYVNLRPCLQCLAMVRAAAVSAVIFDEDWVYPEELEQTYRALASEFDLFGHLVGPEMLVGLNVTSALGLP